MWRAHRGQSSYSETENRQLGEEVGAAGGEVLLDQRVRRAGSHHQKLVVLRHPGRTARDVAFAGGIDLCHARRDDTDHLGDPQGLPLAAEYGPNPPWHDVQLELRGPVVGTLDTVFRERWTDPRSLDTDNPRLLAGGQASRRRPRAPTRCPSSRPIPSRPGRAGCRCCAPIPRSARGRRTPRGASARSRAATPRPSAGPGG